jgi:hypothetical protein
MFLWRKSGDTFGVRRSNGWSWLFLCQSSCFSPLGSGVAIVKRFPNAAACGMACIGRRRRSYEEARGGGAENKEVRKRIVVGGGEEIAEVGIGGRSRRAVGSNQSGGCGVTTRDREVRDSVVLENPNPTPQCDNHALLVHELLPKGAASRCQRTARPSTHKYPTIQKTLS